MRYIKIILIALLVVIGVMFGLTELNRSLSGADVPPTITCDSELIEVSVTAEDALLLSGVTAADKQDGNLTDRVLIQGISKLITENTAKITYIVFDSHGNAASCSRMIRYTDYSKPRFAISKPLIYTDGQEIKLLDRLAVTDALDGNITSSIRVSSLSATTDPEVQTVTLQVTNSMGDTARLSLPVVIYSGTVVRPDVILSDYLIYVNRDTSFNAKEYLVAVDTPIGSGDTANVQITNTVDMSNPGTYYVYYRYPYSVTSGLSVLTVVVQ